MNHISRLDGFQPQNPVQLRGHLAGIPLGDFDRIWIAAVLLLVDDELQRAYGAAASSRFPLARLDEILKVARTRYRKAAAMRVAKKTGAPPVLPDEIVRAIKRTPESMSCREVGAIFEVSKSTVWDLRSGRRRS